METYTKIFESYQLNEGIDIKINYESGDKNKIEKDLKSWSGTYNGLLGKKTVKIKSATGLYKGTNGRDSTIGIFLTNGNKLSWVGDLGKFSVFGKLGRLQFTCSATLVFDYIRNKSVTEGLLNLYIDYKNGKLEKENHADYMR